MKFFWLSSIVLRILLVAGFGATFIYWVIEAVTSSRVATKGLLLISLAPLLLALVSNYAFRAIGRWARAQMNQNRQ